MTITNDTTVRFLEVDPRQLQVNPANVRKKAKGLDELAASIAKVGVQVPLTVRTNGSDDSFVIVAGERRALAAVKAGVATVPVIVRSYDDDGKAELTTMLVENLHREGLTAAEEAKGFEQLAAFGLPIVDIATLTGRSLRRVDAGLTVAESEKAVDIAAKHDLTLEQLAAIAEVQDNDDDVARLIDTAEDDPEGFDHELARVRSERKRRAERQVIVDKLTAEGVKVISKAPSYNFGKQAARLDRLTDANGKKLTPASHKKCPGHCAYVPDRGFGDRKPVYACANPEKNGHKDQYGKTPAATGSPNQGRQSKAAEEKQRREDEDRELLHVSTGVRRKFVRELLARKTAPKGTLAFVTRFLLEYDELYLDDAVVEEITGLKRDTNNRMTRAHSPLLQLLTPGVSDARLSLVLLAKVACAAEEDLRLELLDPPAWRDGREAQWLEFLASVGYRLSDIEQRIIDASAKKA